MVLRGRVPGVPESKTSREIRIGASGWHYKHWIGRFYPPKWTADRMLAYYAEHFDTVELNNTFYRLPPESALASWRDSTPENFRFAVKGSRFITHMKKLKDPEQAVARFFERIDVLGRKCGPVLFQLPPNWPVNLERLDEFLAALPPRRTYAFEFRNETWNCEEALGRLRAWNAAYCIYDLGGYHSPLTVTANTVYVRLHGPGGKYQGSYPAAALDGWARRIGEWAAEGRDVWIYFDNDDSGYAPKNALELKARVERAGFQPACTG